VARKRHSDSGAQNPKEENIVAEHEELYNSALHQTGGINPENI
jgi:hypothetical protein